MRFPKLLRVFTESWESLMYFVCLLLYHTLFIRFQCFTIQFVILFRGCSAHYNTVHGFKWRKRTLSQTRWKLWLKTPFWSHSNLQLKQIGVIVPNNVCRIHPLLFPLHHPCPWPPQLGPFGPFSCHLTRRALESRPLLPNPHRGEASGCLVKEPMALVQPLHLFQRRRGCSKFWILNPENTSSIRIYHFHLYLMYLCHILVDTVTIDDWNMTIHLRLATYSWFWTSRVQL